MTKQEEDNKKGSNGLFDADNWHTLIELNGVKCGNGGKGLERNHDDGKEDIDQHIWESKIYANIKAIRHEETQKWYTISFLIPTPENVSQYFNDNETTTLANTIKDYIVGSKTVMRNISQKTKQLYLDTHSGTTGS